MAVGLNGIELAFLLLTSVNRLHIIITSKLPMNNDGRLGWPQGTHTAHKFI
jgi:hypothetical protein